MKRIVSLTVFLSVVFLAMASIATAAVPNQMQYQGYLTDAEGAPLDTAMNMTFTIYDLSSGEAVKWTETQTNVTVSNGLFNVLLGSQNGIPDTVFADTMTWLGIQVGSDPEITPRTRLVTVPYAYRVSTVDGSTGGIISGDVAIQSDLDVDGDLLVTGKATIGEYNTNTGWGAFVAGGNNSATGDSSAIGGGQMNTASDFCATVGGGMENTASGVLATVDGGRSNEASGDYSTVSGGYNNTVGAIYSTVGGGTGNSASGEYCTVGGGQNNSCANSWGTVGGGLYNDASWLSTVGGGAGNQSLGICSAICGGERDTARGDYSTIGGGYLNTADGVYTTISGGEENYNAGEHSAVPGGRADTLTSAADYSMAFGYQVYVNNGSRVIFFDSTNSGRLGINRDDRNGGIGHPIHVGTDASNGNGARLTAGGTWTNGSSRTFKENFQTLESRELLRKISSMPVEAWQYKGSDERHIGPVSEDFVSAFNVGTMTADSSRDNRYLSPGDVAGVALAGVKELIQENEQLKQMIGELNRKITELEKAQASKGGK